MKKPKQLTTFICPHCKEEQTSITQWQSVWTAFDYDFKTDQYEKVDEGNVDDNGYFACPNCGETIEEDSDIITKLKKAYPTLP